MQEVWPQAAEALRLEPAELPALVEHNNMVAVVLLLRRLAAAGWPAVAPALDALTRMDLSVHSLELVKRLSSAVVLPADFLRLYISSCVRSCTAIGNKNQQNRPVRLVCVFVQCLMRARVIDVRPGSALHVEVLSFCANFSRIREAASLFRLLQSFQEEGPSSPDTANRARDADAGSGAGEASPVVA